MKAILISGLAGSGKTTLANKIAKALGIRAISAGDLLKQMKAKELKGERGWWDSEEGMEFLKMRMKKARWDRELDRKLMRIAEKGNVVITTWTLPWMWGKGIKIYLKASQKERARRISERNEISLRKALEIAKKRDELNKLLYRKLYGIDIEDLRPFDLVINTEEMSERETAKLILAFIKSISTPRT